MLVNFVSESTNHQAYSKCENKDESKNGNDDNNKTPNKSNSKNKNKDNDLFTSEKYFPQKEHLFLNNLPGSDLIVTIRGESMVVL